MNQKLSIRKPVRGLVVIALALALPMTTAVAAEKTTKPSTAKASESLPAAKEVLERYVKEIGGNAAFSKIKSQYGKGRVAMRAQGLTGALEVYAMRPDKILLKMNLAGIGEMKQGYNGKVGWSLDPIMGPMLLKGEQLDQMREQADFDSLLHDPDDYKSMETIEVTEFAGRPCYKLKLVRKSGTEVTEFYDTQTGLLAGSIMTQASPVGQLTVTNFLSEYKTFGDVKLATKNVQKAGPIEQEMTIPFYEFNKVGPAVFELPAEIKALTEKQ